MKKILSIFLSVWIVIFILFLIDSVAIGGDVINAITTRKSETTFSFVEGCYYVLNHGIFTEVSYLNWIINFVLECAIIITAPFAIISAVILALKKNSED